MTGLVSRHDKDWIIVNTTGKYSLIIEKVININFIKTASPATFGTTAK